MFTAAFSVFELFFPNLSKQKPYSFIAFSFFIHKRIISSLLLISLFNKTITIDNTPIEPGNFIVDMDSGKILVDILSSSNMVRRVSLSGGIIYCGSVPTYNDLPANPSNGDMWNVTETDANYIWSDLENRWDKVGGTIDLSNYYTKTECNNKFQPKGTYLTEQNLQGYATQE